MRKILNWQRKRIRSIKAQACWERNGIKISWPVFHPEFNTGSINVSHLIKRF
jgi:hypothetical protein